MSDAREDAGPGAARRRDGQPSRAAHARVRPILANDGARIAVFFEELSVESRGFFHPHPFDAETAERLARESGETARRIRLMATVEDRMVGYAFADGNRATVGLAVADDWQNRGIGRALLDALHREAAARGIERLRLTVYKTNARALHLYRSFGYRIVGEKTTGPSAGLEWEMEAPIRKRE